MTEILINELSLTGQFNSVYEFITGALFKFISLLKEIKGTNVLLYKNRLFYNSKITGDTTIKNIMLGVISRQYDEIRKMKSSLECLFEEPYWENNQKHSRDVRYLFKGNCVTGQSLAEACERDRIVISFIHPDFSSEILQIIKENTEVMLKNLVNSIAKTEYNKLLIDHTRNDIISFLFNFQKFTENEFKNIFRSLFDKYNTEINQKISTIFPNFKYNKDLKHIGEQIFAIEVKDLDNFYKIQFSGMNIVIQKYFNELLSITSNNDFYENEYFKGMIEYFTYLIVDSIILVSDCELKHGIKPSRQMQKQNILRSNESYKSSEYLKVNLSAYSSFSSFNASVFLIRQSIELKIKNALGINFIYDNKGLMLRIPGDKFMDFFFNNKKIELQNIEKSIIRKIHNWTQYFIHGGYVLNIWQIDIAHTLLLPLFECGEKNGNFSLYGGVKIAKEYFNTCYKTELEKYIQSTFFEKKQKNIFSKIKYFFHKKDESIPFKINYMTPEALLY